MKYRIMKRWHPRLERVVYSVQKKYFGLYWRELDFFQRLTSASDMLDNIVPQEVKVL